MINLRRALKVNYKKVVIAAVIVALSLGGLLLKDARHYGSECPHETSSAAIGLRKEQICPTYAWNSTSINGELPEGRLHANGTSSLVITLRSTRVPVRSRTRTAINSSSRSTKSSHLKERDHMKKTQ